MQTAVALAIVLAALAYLAARVIVIARGNRCDGGCGEKNGCPLVKDALRITE